jgi:hypothetical protein
VEHCQGTDLSKAADPGVYTSSPWRSCADGTLACGSGNAAAKGMAVLHRQITGNATDHQVLHPCVVQILVSRSVSDVIGLSCHDTF